MRLQAYSTVCPYGNGINQSLFPFYQRKSVLYRCLSYGAGTFYASGNHKSFADIGRRKGPETAGSEKKMGFFTSSVTALKTVVTAIGAGVAVWGIINLLEGYGNDNPGANAHVR